MKDEPVHHHLLPEEFVDMLEKAPVEASRRQHLDACRTCRDELESLRQTLALVEADAPRPRSYSRRRTWALSSWAAAAVLVAAVGWFWTSGARKTPARDATVSEELLPPVEQDEDFQLLLALSDASQTDLADIADEALGSPPIDTEGWTSDERQRFVERLAEEMRSSS